MWPMPVAVTELCKPNQTKEKWNTWLFSGGMQMFHHETSMLLIYTSISHMDDENKTKSKKMKKMACVPESNEPTSNLYPNDQRIFVEFKCVPFRTTKSGYGFVCAWVILT